MSKHNPTPAPRPRPRVRSSLSAAAVVVWSVWLFPVAAQGSADSVGMFTDKRDGKTYRIVDTLANDTANYPDEINCVIDSVIPEFSHWEEFKSRQDSPLVDLLFFTNSHIRPISFRLFKLSGKSSSRACIWVEIWKMKSSADVRTVDSLHYDDSMRWGMECGGYTPKTFFIFKEYFILVHGCSFVVSPRFFGVEKYIKKRCFNCSTIAGESPNNINKYSCYSDKVIFGQNDKDW